MNKVMVLFAFVAFSAAGILYGVAYTDKFDGVVAFVFDKSATTRDVIEKKLDIVTKDGYRCSGGDESRKDLDKIIENSFN